MSKVKFESMLMRSEGGLAEIRSRGLKLMTKMFVSVRTPNFEDDPHNRILLKGFLSSSTTLPTTSWTILLCFCSVERWR